MKAVYEEVGVQATPAGTPVRLTWGKRTLRVVEILDTWRWGGEWWCGGYPRDYFLIAFPGLTAELYREDRSLRLPGYQGNAATELWVLARLAD